MVCEAQLPSAHTRRGTCSGQRGPLPSVGVVPTAAANSGCRAGPRLQGENAAGAVGTAGPLVRVGCGGPVGGVGARWVCRGWWGPVCGRRVGLSSPPRGGCLGPVPRSARQRGRFLWKVLFALVLDIFLCRALRATRPGLGATRPLRSCTSSASRASCARPRPPRPVVDAPQPQGKSPRAGELFMVPAIASWTSTTSQAHLIWTDSLVTGSWWSYGFGPAGERAAS